MEDRVSYTMLNLVGRKVEVMKLNGCFLTGVFCATAPPGVSTDSTGFTLRYVTHISGEKPDVDFGPRDRVKILWSEVESVLALKSGGPAGWKFDANEETAASLSNAKKKVETDSGISKKSGVLVERDLKAVSNEWLEAGLGSANTKDKDEGQHFDQFAVNETKFGVKSTYKEEIYTTELDKNTFTQEQLEKAERIQRAIENSSSNNTHVLEERGKKQLDESWENEEAKYGAVVGSGDFQSDKYRPPQKRAAMVAAAAQTQSSTAGNGAPTAAKKASFASIVAGGKGQKQPPPTIEKQSEVNKANLLPPSGSPPPSEISSLTPSPSKQLSLSPGNGSESLQMPKRSIPAEKSPPTTNDDKTAAERKKREEQIKDWKNFSKSFQSPSSKPGKSKSTPPPMSLESPVKQTVEEENTSKPQAASVASVAPLASAAATQTTSLPIAENIEKKKEEGAVKVTNETEEKKKKALNPKAKDFTMPAPPPVVTGYPPPLQQPLISRAPRYAPPMPPPYGAPQPGFPNGQPFMYSNAPPLGGYVVPVQVPYSTPGAPRVFFTYPPNMFPQQMVVQVPYAPGPPVPPGVQMGQMPPPASPPQRGNMN